MARRKKGIKHGYAKFLCAYIVIVLVLVGFGLSWLWGYAKEYELSQPDHAMDTVVDELNKNFWNDDTQVEVVPLQKPAANGST